MSFRTGPERNTPEFRNYIYFRVHFRNEEQVIICFGCTGGKWGIWKVREGIFLLGIKWKLFTLAILIILLISILLALTVFSSLTYPSPLLLQFSIPFDFETIICKSETYISPEILIFKLQVLKGGRGKVPTFNCTVNPLVWEVWQAELHVWLSVHYQHFPMLR